VPGNDLPSVVDKDRVGVAEAFDAFGNLPDLCLGMGAGITRVRRQPPQLDLF